MAFDEVEELQRLDPATQAEVVLKGLARLIGAPVPVCGSRPVIGSTREGGCSRTSETYLAGVPKNHGKRR